MPTNLSFNSPRASPFRRPSSPSSPTTSGGRPTTPTHSSPTKNGQSPITSPSKLKQSYTPGDEQMSMHRSPIRSQTEPPPSPSQRSTTANTFSMTTASSRNPRAFDNSHQPAPDALSRLPPQLVHSMREAFSVLDHSGSGSISQADVSETLASLGISDASQFFPPGGPQRLSLPQFLNQLATILVDLSPQQELLNAFSAFDDDDSGQVDVAELTDALLNTTPAAGDRALTKRDVEAVLGHGGGFTGRRVFARNTVGIGGVRGMNGTKQAAKSGEVFRYQEFVGNLTGGNNQGGNDVLRT